MYHLGRTYRPIEQTLVNQTIFWHMPTSELQIGHFWVIMFREREKCLYKRKFLTVIAPIDLSETRIAEVVVSSPIFSGASLIDFADIVSQSATTTALSRTGWVEKNFFAAEQMMTHFILPKKERKREREMCRRRGEQFFNLPSCLSSAKSVWKGVFKNNGTTKRLFVILDQCMFTVYET